MPLPGAMLAGLSRTQYAAVGSGMKKLGYSAKINAPVGDVWTTMLSDSTYRQWTSAFHAGSHFEGEWAKGSEIRFLGPDDEGSLGGMIAVVEVVLDSEDDFVSMFDEAWPIALAKLKEITEENR